jgi:beta-hydroxylase
MIDRRALIFSLIIVAVILLALLIAFLTTTEYDRQQRKSSFTDYYTNHAPTAAINLSLKANSKFNGSIFTPSADIFPNLLQVRTAYPIIRQEAENAMQFATSITKDQFFQGLSTSNDWKKLYIKWYGPTDPLAAQLMPETCRLIESIPEVHLAMLSILEPWAKIRPHAGPFAGCLRYHLGLVTPNSDDCFINIAGRKYSWRDGEDIIFDDTYVHSVENRTNKPRMILFLDVERPMTNTTATNLNRWIIKNFAAKTTRQNDQIELAARVKAPIDLAAPAENPAEVVEEIKLLEAE